MTGQVRQTTGSQLKWDKTDKRACISRVLGCKAGRQVFKVRSKGCGLCKTEGPIISRHHKVPASGADETTP